MTQNAEGCHVTINIRNKGDIHIHACCDRAPAGKPSPCDGAPPPVEGACIPLGLGCKPKQSRRQKLERLRARTTVPSALAAAFFQTARRHLRGKTAANDFEAAVYPVFEGMSPALRGILACAVDSYETTPPDLRDAGLDPSILADPAKPVTTDALGQAVIREVEARAAVIVFGDAAAADERPGLNRFFEPTGEFFESQLQICRVNDLRTASHRPPIELSQRPPAEIQLHCTPVLGPDGQVTPDCQTQTQTDTEPCPGNLLADSVCARVPDVANGDTVRLSGVNFINVDLKVRLTPKSGGSPVEVDAYVFGDVDTPTHEEVNGQTVLIRDCRVKDQLTFVVPPDLAPGVHELQLVMPNTTGFPGLGPTILSNVEFLNIVPPVTARFQLAVDKLHCARETSPQSFGSDEVGLTFIAVEFGAELGPKQELHKRFGDVDSGDDRTINQPIFVQSAPALGMALTIVGFEVDGEDAYRDQLSDFNAAFTHYLGIAWDKLKDVLSSAAGAAISALGFTTGAIVIAVAGVIGLAVIAVVARWGPADLIMEDAIGLSVIDLAELTNVGLPLPAASSRDSERDIHVKVKPQGKQALTYREIREYVADDEDSRYELHLRYNRVA